MRSLSNTLQAENQSSAPKERAKAGTENGENHRNLLPVETIAQKGSRKGLSNHAVQSDPSQEVQGTQATS